MKLWDSYLSVACQTGDIISVYTVGKVHYLSVKTAGALPGGSLDSEAT